MGEGGADPEMSSTMVPEHSDDVVADTHEERSALEAVNAYMRAFNAREGVGAEADTMPPKMEVPLQGGATDGVSITREEFETAKALYYQMVGWDEDGLPTRAKLDELALGWVADELEL